MPRRGRPACPPRNGGRLIASAAIVVLAAVAPPRALAQAPTSPPPAAGQPAPLPASMQVSASQSPVPTRRVTFQEAIDTAVKNNTAVAIASAGILRAEGLLQQARSATLLQVNGNVVVTTLNRVVEFDGQTIVPATQVQAALAADMPIVAAAAWARRAQAEDQAKIAELSLADVRRQISLSTADAYLAIIAQKRVVDADVRARDVAKAHFDLASQLEQKGSGSKLNTLRAEQQWSTDVTLLESARLALYRAQEALGVLMVVNEPVDAAAEPAFDVPAEPATAPVSMPALMQFRTDLQLFAAGRQAAERVVRDSSKEWVPTLDALFEPQTIRPASIFTQATTWQLFFKANIPIFDSGQRAAAKMQRQADLNVARANLEGAQTLATSEVRAAREAVASGTRGLESARAAAGQAQQVVTITNVAFRAGAATNIEVIDAERSARDADTAVAVAEDTLRRAKLELLQALGRFP